MATTIRFGDIKIGFGTQFAPSITRGDAGLTPTFSGSLENPIGDPQVTISFTYAEAFVDSRDAKSDSSQTIVETLMDSLDGNKYTLTMVTTNGDNGLTNRQTFTNARVTSYAPSITANQLTTIAVQVTARQANISYQ